MPTRLAGGLGIGSCRGRSHVRPYAPASNDFEDLVPPRRPPGREAGLGDSKDKLDYWHRLEVLSNLPTASGAIRSGSHLRFRFGSVEVEDEDEQSQFFWSAATYRLVAAMARVSAGKRDKSPHSISTERRA